MPRTTVFNIAIDDPSLAEILEFVDKAIVNQEQHYIATVNSELLQLGLTIPDFKQALNGASLRLCDGIGVQWAAAFMNKSYPVIINILRAPFSLAALVLRPSSAQKAITHRTTGRLLFEDLLEHAQTKGYRIFLLGGGPSVAQAAAQRALNQYPRLDIAGTYAGEPENPQAILEHITDSNILFIAYGSPKQEVFIHRYQHQLRSNIIIGVGGTFDAYTGAKPIGSAFRQIRPPAWVHKRGLESFWRLATQPNRFTRVLKSVAGLIIKAVFVKT